MCWPPKLNQVMDEMRPDAGDGGQQIKMDRDVEEAANYIRCRWNRVPTAAVILGSGLDHFVEELDVEWSVSYDSIPGFARTTALGHAGELMCGSLQSVPLIAFNGRAHFYEGYTFDDLALPIRVVAHLGGKILVVSNASGGLNTNMAAGELMLICDHINLMGSRAASGVAPSHPGPGRSLACYDADLIQRATKIALRRDVLLHHGVYVAVTGPNYETRAEYRALRRLGGDAVGMSTVPEVLAAAACGLRVLAISVITNATRPDAPTVNDAQHVVDVARVAAPQLRTIVSELVSDLPVR